MKNINNYFNWHKHEIMDSQVAHKCKILASAMPKSALHFTHASIVCPL